MRNGLSFNSVYFFLYDSMQQLWQKTQIVVMTRLKIHQVRRENAQGLVSIVLMLIINKFIAICHATACTDV